MAKPTITPFNPAWTEPKPVSHTQYQCFLIGKEVAARGAFVPFSKLADASSEQFGSYRKAKAYLERHRNQIRHRKPSPQRLEVHAGDWFKHVANHFNREAISEGECDALSQSARQRKATIDRKRKPK